jgi:ferric-dicitrate binding protein FerR (iron transport regulator)
MDDMYSVISAMLDDEPFDAAAMSDALETAEGRTLLMDLVALHHLVQTPVSVPVARLSSPKRPWRLAVAAAVVLAALTGYVVGERQEDHVAAAVATAPNATRVVETTGTWQPLPPGGME